MVKKSTPKNPKEDPDGSRRWYDKKGRYHRENGPALEWSDGSREWYIHGILHRDNGPAIEDGEGYREWWINGHRHRENGPAIEGHNGYREWYKNGHRHRENGPAIEMGDGQVEYYLNSVKSSDVEQQVKDNIVRMRAQKEKQELLDELSQEHNISAKINRSSSKISKKL